VLADLPPLIQASCRNPIRSTLANITSCPPQTAKPLINLGLGDPTHYPLHPSPAEASTAIAEAASGRSNGYVEGVGTVKARQAVADYHKKWDGVDYNVKDIVLVSSSMADCSEND
jgi:tyrosine aminotransferase